MSANSGHIFVSHSSDNRQLASELAAFLEARGTRVWIAPRDVRPGTDYSEELQAAIESCAAFVVLVTDNANKSPYVRAETEMAFSNHKPIFPVRIADIQPGAGLALFLKIRHWTDAYGPTKTDNLARLVRELQALGAPAEAPAEPAAQSSAPPPPPPENRTAPPVAPPPPPPPAPLTPENEEKWRAAVGQNADYYLARWRAMDAKGAKIDWNWAACLASLVWFAWRKMWLATGALVAAMLVLGLLTGTDVRPAMLVTVALSFVTGGFGNYLYRQQTAKLVAATEALGGEAQLEALRARGGTSTPALIVSAGFVLLLALLIAIGIVAQRQPELNGTVGPVIEGQIVDPGAPPEGETGDPAAPAEGEIGGTVEGGQ